MQELQVSYKGGDGGKVRIGGEGFAFDMGSDRMDDEFEGF